MVMSNSTDPRMLQLRQQLTTHGIDINDADNGIFLPHSTAVRTANSLTEIAHSRIHTNDYKQAVFDRINPMTNAAEIRADLGKIRTEIAAGTFTY